MISRFDYATAEPFPHAVIDYLWPDTLLDAVLADWPDETDHRWRRFGNHQERKLEGATALWSPAAAELAAHLTAPSFVAVVEGLTGIDGLRIDFLGGGLHHIPAGGYLAPHVDFDRHPSKGLYRRLNILVYLNRGWQPEHGGSLELLGEHGGPHRSVPPTFNRTVIFTCSDRSWHGHPTPWAGPEPRRSFAAYGYTVAAPADVGLPHDTVWMGA